MDRGAERDRRRDARRRHHAESARDHRGARERPRRALGQCGADGGGRSRRSPRQARRRSCRRASITRRFSGRGGRLSRAQFAPWPASAGSMPTIVRRPTIRRSMPVAISSSSAPDRRGSPRPTPPRVAGRKVFLVDDHAEIGGQLVHRGGTIEGGDWRDWAARRRAGDRSRRRPGDDANHGLWRLRRQSRLRLGAAGAAARRALAHPAQEKSSSRPARSSGRSSSPTTTGRA